MKAHIRILVVVLGLGLLGGLGLLVGRTLWVQHRSVLAQQGLEFVPDVAQRIQDFHRVQVRDGRKVWEIVASEARYLAEEQRVEVSGPELQLYLGDGRRVGIKGAAGTVTLNGKELRTVELTGSIEVTVADYTVLADAAIYDRARDSISAPGEVHISGGDLEARGSGLEVEVGAQRLRLRRDVRMTLDTKNGSKGDA